MVKLEMTVRGVTRNVYLEKQVAPKKWRARTYVGPRSKTTVSGFVTMNSNGVNRFTPVGVNASLV